MVKPILFNTDMVKAILEGRKRVTRRAIKPHNPVKAAGEQYRQGFGLWIDSTTDNADNDGHIKDYSISPCWSTFKWYLDKYAPYHIGDVLYVREAWNYGFFESSDAELDNTHWFEEVGKREKKYLNEISYYIYRADFTKSEEIEYGVEDNNGKIKMRWKPSIHMPKEAARIFLRVTNVSVARIQDITTKDMQKEGLTSMAVFAGDKEIARQEWALLWDGTITGKDYNKYCFSSDPWVWVIEFERTGKPNEWV